MTMLTKLKELTAGICAPISPFLGAVLSAETANQWLAAGIKLAGIFGTIASVWWMFRLNRLAHRHAQAQVCADCIAGLRPPGDCPLDVTHRPKNCPAQKA
jgi:hypothetical protein